MKGEINEQNTYVTFQFLCLLLACGLPCHLAYSCIKEGPVCFSIGENSCPSFSIKLLVRVPWENSRAISNILCNAIASVLYMQRKAKAASPHMLPPGLLVTNDKAGKAVIGKLQTYIFKWTFF